VNIKPTKEQRKFRKQRHTSKNGAQNAGRNISVQRERAKLYGRGAFNWATIGRDIRSFGEHKFGKKLLGAATDRLASMIGGHGMYTGRGEYVASNNLVTGADSDMIHQNQPASMSTSGDETGTVTLSHREYITDIFGPVAGNSFNVQTYSLNPALQSTFPFLSQLASNYEEYEFIQMVWSYKSTTTDIGNSTTGQCGTVIMATNYNAASPPFQDKGLMMEYAHSQSCKVTEHMVHGVECDPQKNAGSSILYTRPGPVGPNQDIKTYDLGTFQLAVANSPPAYANLPIGELWVVYTIKLRKPKLFVTRGLDVDKDEFINETALTPTNWFGVSGSSSFLTAQQSNIGCLLQPGVTYAYTGTVVPAQTATSGAGLSIFIPAAYNGNLRLTIKLAGTGFTSALLFPIPVTFLGNITSVTDLYSSTTANPSNTLGISNTTDVIYIVDVYVKSAAGIAYNTSNTTYYGGNNIISCGALAGGGLTLTYACLQIEQYQSLGGQAMLINANQRVAFVNANGQLAVP